MLELFGVSKKYQGSAQYAVDQVSFTVPDSSIVGLLGPNGAGKTTTMKMAAGILFPTSGRIEINGVCAVTEHRKYRQLVGLHLGGDFGFYSRSGVAENLEFFASLAGVRRGGRRQRCLEVLDQVGLVEKADAKVEQLSHGMKQRLHLARAVVAKPPVILLDEPTNGLDPSQAKTIRDMISELPETGASVLLSTHHMHEAYQLSDRVNIIAQGKLLISATCDELLGLSGKNNLEDAYLWAVGSEAEGNKAPGQNGAE